MRFGLIVAAVGACLLISGVANAAESNVYWRVDLNQGSYIIAYGQGTTEEAAWADCRRLRAITRAMTAAETRKSNVSAVTTQAVRWCKNPMQLATVRPDPPPVNCVVSEWGPWSDPPWLACSGGQQTRALVRTRTILTQPANGGTSCPALVETVTETRPCPAVATLSWTPPTRNTDGSALTNLAGFRISYGASAAAMTQTVQVANPGITRYTFESLSPGTYYFAVRAYTTVGTESDLSNVAQKVVP